MAWEWVRDAIEAGKVAEVKARKRGKAKPLVDAGPAKPAKAPPKVYLDRPGRVRVNQVVAMLNISRVTLYRRQRAGLYPPFDGRDQRMPYYLTETVSAMLKKND
ncbi:hypothetical protein [Caballeronia sp. dw_276]|uniref:hypothetical protein n=1 Tax=Caballeronia sp. dw_276 TaxID=2719795 RepID=UPI001BD618CF|nr:hypothetical protein [Caballeronia sp. dw_276]